MGHRLSKIYTRTGDDGTTGLGDGSRAPKASLRLGAIGDVDELNCTVGLAIAEGLREDVAALLIDIQHDLFDLGGEISIPGSSFIQAGAVEKLERAIDAEDGATVDVTNPVDGSVIGTVPKLGARETRRAIEAADKAWPAWRGKTAGRGRSRRSTPRRTDVSAPA